MSITFHVGAFLVVLILSWSGVDSQGNVPVEVIVDSSPCSATCGLGMQTQTLCFLNDSKAATGENIQGTEGPEVTEECRVRKVKCLTSWQCGLRTMTVTAGQRVDIDCLEEVMKEMGRYSWRVSWRYARGVITSDDSLFTRWETPEQDRVVLDPVQEKDAGTYCCDVQDTSFRRVKQIYWGVRVLPLRVLNLEQDSSLAMCNESWNNPNKTDTRFQIHPSVFPILTISFPLLAIAAYKRRKLKTVCVKLCTRQRRNIHPHTVAISQDSSRQHGEMSDGNGYVV